MLSTKESFELRRQAPLGRPLTQREENELRRKIVDQRRSAPDMK